MSRRKGSRQLGLIANVFFHRVDAEDLEREGSRADSEGCAVFGHDLLLPIQEAGGAPVSSFLGS